MWIQGDAYVVVLFVLRLESSFCHCLGLVFIVLVRVTEKSPIGEKAAHLAYDMFCKL